MLNLPNLLRVLVNGFISMALCNILTSDPAELSNKKCTCVNNRCIRSRISGDNLDCRRVELGADVRPTRSRWMSNNCITRCDRKFSYLVSEFLRWDASVRAKAPG